MSELLQVYRRSVCVSPAVIGVGYRVARFSPPALRRPPGSTTHALQFRGEILVHRAVRVTVTSR